MLNVFRNVYSSSSKLFVNKLKVSVRCWSFIEKKNIMKYLNVAEKNDAAKTIAGYLSRGTATRREGFSKFNKIYEFKTTVFGEQAVMIMTSVSGHLLNYEFVGSYKSWHSCNPLSLFDAPVAKSCSQDYQNIKKTLEREIKACNGLIIWTDCDREGENIGFEIIQVCTDVKPNLKVCRAKFSEITSASVNRALQTLGQPNANVSNAVDVRQELDLRIGAAFTRFQTLRLQKAFPEKLSQSLVSYGSCQFPTLGFVVERYRAVENFVPESFWKIKVSHEQNNLNVDFSWKRVRVFDEQACMVLYDLCKEQPTATVMDVKSKSKSKWRPLPLDTVELEKLGSRKLKINAKEVMKIAEKLYTQGIISYPRTETNIYPKELNLQSLVEKQFEDNEWGWFARKILEAGGPTPRQGSKSDQAHPPIHPTKHVTNLSGNEKKVYDLIVRSFLACCSSDAQGHETIVEIELSGERFSANGLVIIARNYLEVYPYDKWSAKEIHHYEVGQKFNPTHIDMADGQTSPPNLLTEADLISLMEKHGIGTDATHADHIETIKNRSYVALADNVHFVPGLLGMGLVEGYDAMRLAHSFSKPHLRAGLEADLKEICEGRKRPQDVLAQQVAKYKEAYMKVCEEATKIDEALSNRFNQAPQTVSEENIPSAAARVVMPCPKCSSEMVTRNKKDGQGMFITCMGYPQCKNAIWLPNIVEKLTVLSDHCDVCGSKYKKVEIKWRGKSLEHLYPSPHVCCLGGCDTNLLQVLNINPSSVKPSAVANQRQPSTTTSTSDNFITNRTTVRRVPGNSLNSGASGGQASYSTLAGDRSNVNPSDRNWFNGTNDSGYSSTQARNDRSGDSSGSRWSHAGDTDTEDNQVVCNCGEAAILLTVKKQSANCGRQFYKCPKPKDSSGCDFFLWAVNPNDGSSSTVQTSGSTIWNDLGPSQRGGITSGEEGDALCRCQLPAKRLTVQKEGPNKGRTFLCCPNPPATKCNFFDWGDSPAPDTTWGAPPAPTTYSTRGRGRGRGQSRNRGGNSSSEPGGRSKKCGACRQEGHTRNKCPRLS